MSSAAFSRRHFGAVVAGTCVPACLSQVPSTGPSANVQQEFAAMEHKIGGRIGVYAVALDSSLYVEYRADERFALCSTFKWVLVAQVLARVDRGELRLDQRVPFGEADLLEYAPVTRAHVADGALSVEELLRAAMVVSDNTAGNLLLKLVGGPSSLTAFMRSLGDTTTRLDRFEPLLNGNAEGDPRDTTSPRAMTALLYEALFGDALSPASSARLLSWFYACETGKHRIRAGLPPSWTVGDKTGTGERGACNDLAIARPPRRSSMLIAIYLSDGSASLPEREATIAAAARAATLRL